MGSRAAHRCWPSWRWPRAAPRARGSRRLARNAARNPREREAGRMAPLHCTNHVYLNSSAVRRALTGESSGELDPSIILKKSQTPRGFQPAGGRRREEVESPSPYPSPLLPALPSWIPRRTLNFRVRGPRELVRPLRVCAFVGPEGRWWE